MWDEDPKWQAGHWRTVIFGLKAVVVFAALWSLVFGSWEPLGSVLAGLAAVVGVLFLAWVVPIWLLGKVIEQLARVATGLRREKSLKPAAH